MRNKARNAALAMGVLLCAVAFLPEAGGVEQATLSERLRAGLKARTKSEFAFIDRVVVAVKAGKLPQRFVDRVFFWARKKAAEAKPRSVQKRPMVYFQPALIELAADLKIPF